LERSALEFAQRQQARRAAQQAGEAEAEPAEAEAEKPAAPEDAPTATAAALEGAAEGDKTPAVGGAGVEPEERWSYPYAAGYPPRLFVVYPDGNAVEVLDEAQYKLYVTQQTTLKGCTHTVTQVQI
jgi:hypothetical protein